MNPNLDNLLSRLDKVKGRNGNFIACCPAHGDRNPSMTIKETEDGKILMHCFAGCSVQEIAGAIGFDLTDLFPPTDRPEYGDKRQSRKPRFLASDLLKVISYEATIVAVAALDLSRGKPLSEVDRQRLVTASSRINEALELSQ